MTYEPPGWLLSDSWPVPRRVVRVPPHRLTPYVSVPRYDFSRAMYSTPDEPVGFTVDQIRLERYLINSRDSKFIRTKERFFGYDPVEMCLYTTEAWIETEYYDYMGLNFGTHY